MSNVRVQVFSASGRSLGVYGGHGQAPGQMLSARCLRIDGAGHAFVADPVAGLVHVFDASDGRFLERFRPTLPDGQPALPEWLAIDGGALVITARPV